MSRIKTLNKNSISEGIAHLKKVDADLKKILIKRQDKINPFNKTSGFEGLISLIVEQQLSVASAKAIFTRVKLLANNLTPEILMKLDDESLKSTGLSRQKISYCRNISLAAIDGTLNFEGLEKMEDDQVVNELIKIKGVGEWTAQCYLMGCMKRLDAWPSSDLGLLVAIQRIKGLEERPKSFTIEEIAEPWKPFRTIAALLLWSTYDKE
jgi:DNA-3-methyladenine glycosylase II